MEVQLTDFPTYSAFTHAVGFGGFLCAYYSTNVFVTDLDFLNVPAVWQETGISLELLQGLFCGDGCLSQDKAQPNSFTFRLHFNGIQGWEFADHLRGDIESLFQLPANSLHFYTYKMTSVQISTSDRGVITTMLYAGLGDQPMLPHRLHDFLDCYHQWGMTYPGMGSTVTTQHLAGWALSDGYISIKPNTFSPSIILSASYDHMPQSVGELYVNAIPGSRYEISSDGTDAYLHLVHCKEWMTQILISMANTCQLVDGPLGPAAILGAVLVETTPRKLTPQLKQTVLGKMPKHRSSMSHYEVKDQRYLRASLSYLVVYCRWAFKVQASGGIPSILSVPLEHESERHYRDPMMQARVYGTLLHAWGIYRASSSYAEFVTALYSSILANRSLDQWNT